MSVASGLDQRIQQLVEAHRDQLEQRVDELISAELERLVAERVAAARNGGNGDFFAPGAINSPTAKEVEAPATKVCTGCGMRKPITAYDRYRAKCKACRRDAARESARRKAAAKASDVRTLSEEPSPNPPFPHPSATA